jgi:hypothetical protein
MEFLGVLRFFLQYQGSFSCKNCFVSMCVVLVQIELYYTLFKYFLIASHQFIRKLLSLSYDYLGILDGCGMIG